MRGEANHEGLNDKEDAIDLKTDLCEQSDDFSDDVLRLNSGKLTSVLTFPDQLLACQKESYLLHHCEFLNNCQKYHDRNQVFSSHEKSHTKEVFCYVRN